jgi:hypothetical protein
MGRLDAFAFSGHVTPRRRRGDSRTEARVNALVKTIPSIQRPNGMLRIVPPNESFTTDRINGFGLSVPSHRQGAVFRLMRGSARTDWDRP